MPDVVENFLCNTFFYVLTAIKYAVNYDFRNDSGGTVTSSQSYGHKFLIVEITR